MADETTPIRQVPRVAGIVAAVALLAIVAAVVVALSITKALDNRSTPLVVTLLSIVGTAFPALVAAAYSERAARDIRNGVVREQVRRGSREAIRDEQVVTRDGPVVTAELAALTELLAANRISLDLNTQAMNHPAKPPVERHGPPDPQAPI